MSSLRINGYRYCVRSSYTGKSVQMERIKGIWKPITGRYVKRPLGKGLEVNILCHDKDKDPPKNYDPFKFKLW